MIGRVEKVFLALAASLAGGSGLVFAWMKYLIKNPDPYSVVGHPWQPWFLSVHLLTSPLLLFAFALIARDHVLGRFRDKRAQKGRRTGVAAAMVFVVLAASGYGLQVLVGEGSRAVAGYLHLGAGILFLLAYVAHALLASGGALRSVKPRVAKARRARGSRD